MAEVADRLQVLRRQLRLVLVLVLRLVLVLVLRPGARLLVTPALLLVRRLVMVRGRWWVHRPAGTAGRKHMGMPHGQAIHTPGVLTQGQGWR